MKTSLAPLVLAACACTAGSAVATAAEVVGNPKAAVAKVEMCIGCHGIQGGYKTAFPEVYRVPMIGGQSAKYLEAALKAYDRILSVDDVTVNQSTDVTDYLKDIRAELAEAFAGRHSRIRPARKGAIAQTILRAWVEDRLDVL